jgi:Rieske Fe-S protein
MIDRRTILKGITAIPLLAAAGGLGAALISYLKPTTAPLGIPAVERPLSKNLVAANLNEFPNLYDHKEFVFTQATVEYSDRQKQATDILGYLVRIPNDQLDPAEVGAGPNGTRLGYAVSEHNGQTYSIVAVSRICAHLGCIFEYHKLAEVCAGFNYCDGTNSMFSCPCHLSVYNPVKFQEVNGMKLPGLVVSGPAPRAPFPFTFTVEKGEIIIKGYG